MTIKNYINGFIQQTYNLPIWQREDCWDIDYRQQLINSILDGIDLPKIYIGDIINIGKVIIDGGHRTRTLKSFMNNEFFIVINDEKVFYTDDPSNNSIRNNRILTDEEREYFNKYEISITTYTNINESMARNIFNKLQNAEPMTIQDVINSWESPLVDYLRNQKHLITNGQNLHDQFTYIRGLPKPENSELLYQCLSFWTIINPFNDIDISESESALKYLEKGKTRESKCFKYLKEYDNRYHGNITDEKKNRFVEGIDFIIEYLLGRPLPMADMNTLIYSKFWVPSFSVDKFTELSNTIEQYNTLKKAADRARKNHNYDLQITTNRAADLLNSQNNGFLEQWIKTRTSGGSSEKAMRVRNDIILQKCLNIEDEDDTESNSDVETNSDDNPDMVSVDIVESL
jgi:hypothetical protein